MPGEFFVTTSWDDGHPLDFRIVELLERHQIPGTFYIPLHSEFGVMDRRQIYELSKRFEVGAHTFNHVYLDTVPLPVAEREMDESKATLEDICSKRCSLFCFPGGRFSSSHLEIARKIGFAGVRTVELMSLRPPSLRDGIAMIPTTLQLYPHSRMTYVKNVLKRSRLGNVRCLGFSVRTSELLTRVRLLLSRCAKTGGVFHLWGHSWEIEALGLWPKLDAVLAEISSHASQAKFVSNGALTEYAR